MSRAELILGETISVAGVGAIGREHMAHSQLRISRLKERRPRTPRVIRQGTSSNANDQLGNYIINNDNH